MNQLQPETTIHIYLLKAPESPPMRILALAHTKKDISGGSVVMQWA